ncbi:MAG: hypothetical protein WCR95_08700 [Eubacteriales bacterium]
MKEQITELLDKFKSGVISAEEAQSRIETIIAGNIISKNIEWQDDNAIRIAVFRGRRLLKNGFGGNVKCNITLTGDPEDVYCDHSLNVKGNVYGSAQSGHSLSCTGNIGGNVKAGHSVTCGNVGQSVKAGHSVKCDSVNGDIKSGHGVVVGKRNS